MKEDKYIKRVASNPLFRVMAWVCLIIIVVLIAATLITGVTGSRYFMGCLVLCIVVPIFMYIALWIGRVLSSADREHVENPQSVKIDADTESKENLNKASERK